MTTIDAIRAALEEHTADWTTWGDDPEGSEYYTCLCGLARWHVNTSADYYQAHAAHLAAVVAGIVEGELRGAWDRGYQKATDGFEVTSRELKAEALREAADALSRMGTADDDLKQGLMENWLRARAGRVESSRV